MKIHRVAVVGCGALARHVHLPNIRKNSRMKLVAACDMDVAAAESARADFGAERAETDWRKVVAAKDVDLCVLSTHTNLRGEFIIPALESGKAVYTEKPLAPSLEDMRAIVRASRATGRAVCVGHNRRSSPAMLEFRRLLEKARRGPRGTTPSMDRSEGRAHLPEEDQMQLLIRINDDARSWKHWIFSDAEGILFAEMVHYIDLALWFNAAPAVRAYVEGKAIGNFGVVLRFADGSTTLMHHTLVGNFDYPKELFEATANNITVAMDQHFEVRQIGMRDEPTLRVFDYASESSWAKRKGMTGYMAEQEEEARRAAAEKRPTRWINVNKGHSEHLDRFLDHLEGRGENPCSVESAVPVTRVALRLLESSASGLPVKISPDDLAVG
ncbi:MAG: Gfo/Idh/MocA family oxidoreductase [Verrucomicrobiae bacterium]|nr:Gfo/Idh/MocA family oxidoreductase [Verrucomicrobiae bacterium]